MQFLKAFKFKNGFTLSLDLENGNLFYTLTNEEHEYRFFSKDTLKTVGYYNMRVAAVLEINRAETHIP